MNEEDIVEKKLRQIAQRLEQLALSQQEGCKDVDASDKKVIPLKVTVAKPFKDDLQGYFVLTLVYASGAECLDRDLILSQAGVHGSTLKAQVWSSSTFQLLIPKYETKEVQNSNTKHYRRSKEELVLICMKLAFGIIVLHALGMFIRNGGGAFESDNVCFSEGTYEAKCDADADAGFLARVSIMMTWIAAIMRQTVRRVALATWTMSVVP